MANRTFAPLAAGYRTMWASTTINGGKATQDVGRVTKNIVAAQVRYKKVEDKTGVPWFWIGAIHYRESSNDFAGVLHNGEKIIGKGRKTRLVPAGRGPFDTWEEAAIDALLLKGLHKIDKWTIARMLYEAERFNGFGYMSKGINSPYVWGGTNHQQPGMYVADHVFDRSKNDPRIGVAAIIQRLAETRKDVGAVVHGKAKEPEPAPAPAKPAAPEPMGWFAAFIKVILAIFKR